MANAARERAPKMAAVRLRAGRVGLRGALTATTAAGALGRLTHGGRVVCLSKGAFGFGDCVRHLLTVSGSADVLLTTWAIGAKEIAAFRALVTDGAIRTLRLLVDASFVQRQPAYTASLRASFGPDCVRLATCHAKLATLVNAQWAFVVLSSANLNENKRLEVFSVEDNRRLATALAMTLDGWFASPADWDVSRAEHARRFDAWGEPTPKAAIVAADDAQGGVEARVRPMAPAMAGDAAFFSDDPWGVDLRRVGISFTR